MSSGRQAWDAPVKSEANPFDAQERRSSHGVASMRPKETHSAAERAGASNDQHSPVSSTYARAFRRKQHHPRPLSPIRAHASSLT